ncbi:hypothetical protein assk_405 [Aeromonas phage Assk]|nr:hypothetical protein assk_405 [Aeromonas phage Assk]
MTFLNVFVLETVIGVVVIFGLLVWLEVRKEKYYEDCLSRFR